MSSRRRREDLLVKSKFEVRLDTGLALGWNSGIPAIPSLSFPSRLFKPKP